MLLAGRIPVHGSNDSLCLLRAALQRIEELKTRNEGLQTHLEQSVSLNQAAHLRLLESNVREALTSSAEIYAYARDDRTVRDALRTVNFDSRTFRLFLDGDRVNLDQTVLESGIDANNAEHLQVVREQQGGGDVDMADDGDDAGDAVLGENRVAGTCAACLEENVAVCHLFKSPNYGPCCKAVICRSCIVNFRAKHDTCPHCREPFDSYGVDFSLEVNPTGEFATRKNSVARQVSSKSLKKHIQSLNKQPQEPAPVQRYMSYDDLTSYQGHIPDDDPVVVGEWTSPPYMISHMLRPEFSQEEAGCTVKAHFYGMIQSGKLNAKGASDYAKQVGTRLEDFQKDAKRHQKDYAYGYLQLAEFHIDKIAGSHVFIQPLLDFVDKYHDDDHDLMPSELVDVLECVAQFIDAFVKKELHAKVKKEKLDFIVNYLDRIRGELLSKEASLSRQQRQRMLDRDTDSDEDDVSRNPSYRRRGGTRPLRYRASGRNSPSLS